MRRRWSALQEGPSWFDLTEAEEGSYSGDWTDRGAMESYARPNEILQRGVYSLGM